MSSFVSSILHNSANKIESMSKRTNNQPRNSPPQQVDLGSRLAMQASTSVNSSGSGYYYSPPPPYDPQQKVFSPTPTPSTSWTSEMSALAEKIKDDVTNSFKSNKSTNDTQNNIDRHSISQGMKLVSIAADEYEQGNESVALDIYLTGVDKVLMALPNKTDMNTKMAIKEKLMSVEERVGIVNLTNPKVQQENKDKSSMTNSFILSSTASTVTTIDSKSYPVYDEPSVSRENAGYPMNNFKQFGQNLVHIAVTCAVLVKKSPLPDLVYFLFGYIIQLFIWIDSQYHVMERLQNVGIQCIKYVLEADERYHLHEFITEGVYMMIAAGLKAAIAFKETPGYDSKVQNKSESTKVSTNRRNDDLTTSHQTSSCSPPTSQKTRASWTWSAW